MCMVYPCIVCVLASVCAHVRTHVWRQVKHTLNKFESVAHWGLPSLSISADRMTCICSMHTTHACSYTHCYTYGLIIASFYWVSWWNLWNYACVCICVYEAVFLYCLFSPPQCIDLNTLPLLCEMDKNGWLETHIQETLLSDICTYTHSSVEAQVCASGMIGN